MSEFELGVDDQDPAGGDAGVIGESTTDESATDSIDTAEAVDTAQLDGAAETVDNAEPGDADPGSSEPVVVASGPAPGWEILDEDDDGEPVLSLIHI